MARSVQITIGFGPNVIKTGVCEVTGKRYTVTVPDKQWSRWKAGAYIQDAMPQLSDDEREFLISGMTPAEFEKEWGLKSCALEGPPTDDDIPF